MTISVVITTYNGERFISEQVESIMHQTRKADEIIIVDDCSTDKTITVLEEFANCSDIIHLSQNKSNQGWRKNFHLAIQESHGDVIVLCDQDDIWYENKLEIVESILSSHPEIDLLVTEFDELENGKLKKKPRKKQLSQIPLNEKLIHTYYPGCTYAFRRSFFNDINPFWNEELPHDAQLGIAAKIYKSMYVYKYPLIIYRRHQNNATKRSKPTLEKKQSYIKTEYEYVNFLNKIINNKGRNLTDYRHILCTGSGIERYVINREALLDNCSIKKIVSALIFIKYYYSPKTCLGDIIFALKKHR